MTLQHRLIHAAELFPALVSRSFADKPCLRGSDQSVREFQTQIAHAKRNLYRKYVSAMAMPRTDGVELNNGWIVKKSLEIESEYPGSAESLALTAMASQIADGAETDVIMHFAREQGDSFWAGTHLLDTGCQNKATVLFMQVADWSDQRSSGEVGDSLRKVLQQWPEMRIVFFNNPCKRFPFPFDDLDALHASRCALLPLDLWPRAIGYLEFKTPLFRIPLCTLLEEACRQIAGEHGMHVLRHASVTRDAWLTQLKTACPDTTVLDNLLYRRVHDIFCDLHTDSKREPRVADTPSVETAQPTPTDAVPLEREQLIARHMNFAGMLSYGALLSTVELAYTTRVQQTLMRAYDDPFQAPWLAILASDNGSERIEQLIEEDRWDMLASSPFCQELVVEEISTEEPKRSIGTGRHTVDPDTLDEAVCIAEAARASESSQACDVQSASRLLIHDATRHRHDKSLLKAVKANWSEEKMVRLLLPLPIQAVLDGGFGQLRDEFPWMTHITNEIEQQLRRAVALGCGHFRFRPLLLVGPPGGGKTRYAQRLAECMQVGFRAVVAGGSSDNRNLMGTSRGWNSAHPSAVVDLVASSNMANPLMLIDEIDKCSTSRHNGRILDFLLQMLEPINAKAFHDECLLCDIDLSLVNWILTANSLGSIPAPLLSRVQIMTVGQPGTEHFAGLVKSIRREMAQAHGVHPGLIPYLDCDELAIVCKSGDAREATRIAQQLIDARLAAPVEVMH